MVESNKYDPDDQRAEKKDKPNLVEDLHRHETTEPKDIIAYAVMIVGILLTFFIPFVGGLLIGIIGALYFSDEILGYVVNIRQRLIQLGNRKSLLAAGVVLGLLLQAPGIMIGAAIVTTVKYALEK